MEISICNRCGKVFEKRYPLQDLCYEDCLPQHPVAMMFDKYKVQRDCIMYREKEGKEICAGLCELYCGYGNAGPHQ